MGPDRNRHFGRDRTTLFFDPDAQPLAELKDGERFTVATPDSICGLWRRLPPGGLHIDEIIERLGGACPLTGPFVVTGADKGAVLEVSIHSVKPDPAEGVAWSGVFHGFGALSSDTYGLQESLGSEVKQIPYRDGVAEVELGGRKQSIPLHPFVGTIGVAPARERRMTFSQSPEYLGDVDQPGITDGATVVLPVNVDGGLLSLGDAHGAQGDGEITGIALEIEAVVDLTVKVSDRDSAQFVALPQINTATNIGSIAGFHGVNLGDCARAAYTDLARRLVRYRGFSNLEAYELLGQVGRLRVGNMIDPFYSVVASIDRTYVE
jgi:acetamidase/formamidase